MGKLNLYFARCQMRRVAGLLAALLVLLPLLAISPVSASSTTTTTTSTSTSTTGSFTDGCATGVSPRMAISPTPTPTASPAPTYGSWNIDSFGLLPGSSKALDLGPVFGDCYHQYDKYFFSIDSSVSSNVYGSGTTVTVPDVLSSVYLDGSILEFTADSAATGQLATVQFSVYAEDDTTDPSNPYITYPIPFEVDVGKLVANLQYNDKIFNKTDTVQGIHIGELFADSSGASAIHIGSIEHIGQQNLVKVSSDGTSLELPPGGMAGSDTVWINVYDDAGLNAYTALDIYLDTPPQAAQVPDQTITPDITVTSDVYIAIKLDSIFSDADLADGSGNEQLNYYCYSADSMIAWADVDYDNNELYLRGWKAGTTTVTVSAVDFAGVKATASFQVTAKPSIGNYNPPFLVPGQPVWLETNSPGTLYILDAAASVNDLASLENAMANLPDTQQVSASVTNDVYGDDYVDLQTTNLAEGLYNVYLVDPAGTLTELGYPLRIKKPDMNGDGRIDIGDIVKLQHNYASDWTADVWKQKKIMNRLLEYLQYYPDSTMQENESGQP